MGWIISVGKAGAKGRAGGTQAQALSLRVNVQGMEGQVKVAGAVPAWQAQRVWQNVLSTLVGQGSEQ
jgi:hypothetical protein